jgi:hypothetical protein
MSPVGENAVGKRAADIHADTNHPGGRIAPLITHHDTRFVGWLVSSA